MKFPGYWVIRNSEGVKIQKYEFDETELSPESDWKEAWENEGFPGIRWGGLSLDTALAEAGKMLRTPFDEAEVKPQPQPEKK